jgi:hypothetical protein
MAQIRRREKCLFSGRPSVSACENCSSGWTRTRWFDSGLAPQTFLSTLTPRQVREKWRGYGGSIKSISVERDAFRQEQLLKPLLLIEGGLHPQVRGTR